MNTIISAVVAAFLVGLFEIRAAEPPESKMPIFNPGRLKPMDSKTRLKVGDTAPNFTLRSVDGRDISLRDFRGKKAVVLSFVPAAFTPICSAQWPGYNLAREIFDKNHVALIGITVDNIASLYAWTKEMGGLWFDVVSDFYPHGKTANAYGVLRGDGTAERALFVIDKKGVIRYIDVHDINERPPLEILANELTKLGR